MLNIANASEVYRWTDKHGHVHFGDKLASYGKGKLISVKTQGGSWKPFDIQLDVIATTLTEEEENRIREDVNNVYRFYSKVMYLDLSTTIPVNIKLFANKQHYTQYLNSLNLGIKNADRTRGVFIPAQNQIAVWLRANKESTFGTIKHEVSHAIISSKGRLPTWLNEGLAEQMENLESIKNNRGQTVRLVVNRSEENQKGLAYSQRREGLMPIDKMLSYSNAQWRNMSYSHDSMYPYAGEFIYFLLSNRAERSFIVKLVSEHVSGNKVRSAALIKNSHFGGINYLQSKWDSWLNKGGKNSISF